MIGPEQTFFVMMKLVPKEISLAAIESYKGMSCIPIAILDVMARARPIYL